MPILPLFGTGTKGKSANVTAQRRVNLYAERFAEQDKSPVVYYPRPGLLKGFNGANTAGAFIGGPLRGLLVLSSLTGVEYVYAAQGRHTLLAVTDTRFLDSSDFIVTATGPVQFASLGNKVLFVDGYTIYDPAAGSTLSNLGVADVPTTPKSICAIAGRWVVDDQSASGRFRWSGLYDPIDWDPLNFATAESVNDPLVQVFERGGELLLFGNRSLEFWTPTGDAAVFARVGGSGIDWGLGVFDSPRKANNSVFFIGRNLGGQPQVCRLDQYQVGIVSTPDVDKLLNDALDVGGQITTAVVTHSGHTWYIVNLNDTSIVYDTAYNEWSEWQTSGARWAGNYSSQYRDTAIVTDYRDGRVYYLSDDRYTDGDERITREITSRHVFADLDRIGVARLLLDVECGDATVAGTYPQCIQFLGTADSTAAVGGATTTASFTVETRIRLDRCDTSEQVVIEKNNGGNGWKLRKLAGLGPTASSATLEFDATGNVGNAQVTMIQSEEANLAFVYNSVEQTLTAYKNGVVVDTKTGVTDMSGAAATVLLGFGNDGTGAFCMAGAIGMTRIWSGVRTGAEILANMNTRLPAGTANMVSQWWEFRPGTSSFASDGSSTSPIILGILTSPPGSFPTQFTSGALIEPSGGQIMLQISRDGGHTFGNEMWAAIGKLGEYFRQVAWRRLGMARDMVFRFRVADPVKTVFINASLQIDKEQ